MRKKLVLNKIYNESCLVTIAKMPDEFIDLTVTSPPYDHMGTYSNKVIGNRNKINSYAFEFEKIAAELFRVTKKGGVVVWIVGDATS